MGEFTAETLIDAPIARVWVIMTDFARAPEWMPGIEAVEPVDDTIPGAGKQYHVTLSTSGRGAERIMSLAGWQPPNGFTLASREGNVTARYIYVLEAREDSTRVVLTGTCTARGLLWRALAPLITWLMARHDRPQMALLKNLVEGEP
jgi:carbon monoxide dehydrogenase subunit G